MNPVEAATCTRTPGGGSIEGPGMGCVICKACAAVCGEENFEMPLQALEFLKTLHEHTMWTKHVL